MPAIETSRLRIRTQQPCDATALEAVLGDPEVMRYSTGVMDREQIRAWLASYTSPEKAFAPWAVEITDTGDDTHGKVIGYCGLMAFTDIDGHPETELAFRLAKDWWGKGLATEAAGAVRDYAFGALHLDRLVALVDPGNSAAENVVRKLGFRYEKDIMMPDYDYPDRLFVLEAARGAS